jgi:hypothetical protein
LLISSNAGGDQILCRHFATPRLQFEAMAVLWDLRSIFRYHLQLDAIGRPATLGSR